MHFAPKPCLITIWKSNSIQFQNNKLYYSGIIALGNITYDGKNNIHMTYSSKEFEYSIINPRSSIKIEKNHYPFFQGNSTKLV